MKNEKSSTRYNALGFSFGVSFNFGADKGGNNINQPQPEVKTSSACNCVAPTPLYIKEYPSSGLTLSTSNPWPTYIPVSDLSSGKKMHFAFMTGPCYNTTSNPCYGYYKATVNGHSVNSSSVGYSSQTHLEIPVNYLVAGLNTITVQGISGTTICTLATSTVTVGSAPSSSGAVTLVKNCCVSISGPQHTSTYTGQTSFTMSGSVTGAVLEITSRGVISYEAFVNGGKTACYSKPITVRLVNNVTHFAIPTSTVNGMPLLSYNPKFNIDCMNRATISIKHNILGKVLVEGPDISDNWPTTSTFERNGLFTEDPDNHELLSTFTNPNTKEIVTIKSVVTVDEKGEMKLMKVQEASSTLNGITKPFKVLNSKEHQYVGHITLLK
ncbi:hypothetical protein FNJ88_00950 [Chryseobacterium sp. SNU WT5]|uniref:hypothetical protein n=1 Tax=Chryseobacterium sp. SNU WT5 TaxID=2594269 RepID=UPI00117D07A6|nr:hypothetical protein [Chryseobacterium sp. SNU WT5]QDP84192.1 hypothetical protein FNJ88_00950 [Chryseobacterium sp. SNU WT5]